MGVGGVLGREVCNAQNNQQGVKKNAMDREVITLLACNLPWSSPLPGVTFGSASGLLAGCLRNGRGAYLFILC